MTRFSLEPLTESNVSERGERLNDLVFLVSLAVVAFITILANLLVITAFCIDKRLRRTNNYFVISLTIAGLLTGGYSIPLYCITTWTKTEPLSLCKLCGFLDNSLATITVWTLALTSLDRYFMVINYKSYKSLITRTRAKIVLVMVWIYGSAVCSPPLFGWNEYWFSNETSTCGIKFGENVTHKEYFLFYFFSSFPIPLLLVTFCYTRIFIQAWGVYKRRERRQSEANRRSEQSQRFSCTLETQTPTPNCNGSFKARLNSTRILLKTSSIRACRFQRTNSIVGGMNIDKTVRATLMVFILVLTNITCSFPIFVFSLVLYWSSPIDDEMTLAEKQNKGKVLDASYTVSMFLFFLNSALNPIMYGLFNTNFRGTFNSLLRCKLPRSRKSVRYSRVNGRASITRNGAPGQASLKQRLSSKFYLTPHTATESVSPFPTIVTAMMPSPSLATNSQHSPPSISPETEAHENPARLVIQMIDSVTESSSATNTEVNQQLTKV